MLYEESMELTVTRREIEGIPGYRDYCDVIRDGDFYLNAVLESMEYKAENGEMKQPLIFHEKNSEIDTSYYVDEAMKTNALTVFVSTGKMENGSEFVAKVEDYPKGFVDSVDDSYPVKFKKYDDLCTSEDLIKLTLKICNSDKNSLEKDKSLAFDGFKRFKERKMPFSKNLVVIDHKVLGKSEGFPEQCFERISQVAKWKEEGKLGNIENISYVFAPMNGERIEISLKNPENLPSGDKEFYEKTILDAFPVRKNVILDKVLYNSIMSADEYKAEKEGKLNLNMLSGRTTQFLSNLANDWDEELSGVHLIQLNKVLCHGKADIKVMVDPKLLPAEKCKYYALDNGGWIRREKSRFFQRNGVKIEMFTLQTQKEYELDMEILKGRKQDIVVEENKSKNREKKM